jgi:hypothetical protein
VQGVPNYSRGVGFGLQVAWDVTLELMKL